MNKKVIKQRITLSRKWRVEHYDVWFCGRHWIWNSRLFIPILSVWLTFILGSNIWGNLNTLHKIIPNSCMVLGFCVVLCLGSSGWLAYLGTKNKVKFKSCKIKLIIYGSAFYMTFVSFVYSAIIGAILRIFVFHTKECEYCGELRYNHCHQWQYWGGEQAHFYWVAVCLAVFIGIVIQSFMDNKSPADEL
jgi:hypothetical protein